MIINLHLVLSKLTPVVFVQRIPGSKEHTQQQKITTHKVSPGHMVPGWSGSVPVQLIFFNSYILNTFLYDKQNLAWALSFILNKIYEIHSEKSEISDWFRLIF